jgi:hypothetical protein
MTTTQEPVPNEQKFYNPMIVQLETLEIKDKTVENYLKQIKNNFYCSVKAHYLIARDLFDAKQNLDDKDYIRLIKTLQFNGSTQSKYLAIGRDVRLWKLFIQGKLPMKWTSQYLLTQLTDEQFKEVQKIIDPETPARKITELAKLDKKTQQKIANDLLTLLQVEIDKTQIKSTSTLEKIVERVKSALSTIPQIKINDENVDTVKVRVDAFIEKQKAKLQKLEELKEEVSKSEKRFTKAQAIGVSA